MEISDGFAAREETRARWLHLKEELPEIFTIVENNFVNFHGHYDEKKMRVCDRKNCRLCMAGIGSQRRYCFDVVVVDSGEQYLYETSESVANQIRDIIELDRRGERIFFKVRRMSISKHSNCIVERVTSEVNRQYEKYKKQNLKEIILYQESCFKKFDDLRREKRENSGPNKSFKDFQK